VPMGAVAVLSTFGNNELPDAHIFRIEKGKLRYVHTLTHLLQSDFKGSSPKQ